MIGFTGENIYRTIYRKACTRCSFSSLDYKFACSSKCVFLRIPQTFETGKIPHLLSASSQWDWYHQHIRLNNAPLCIMSSCKGVRPQMQLLAWRHDSTLVPVPQNKSSQVFLTFPKMQQTNMPFSWLDFFLSKSKCACKQRKFKFEWTNWNTLMNEWMNATLYIQLAIGNDTEHMVCGRLNSKSSSVSPKRKKQVQMFRILQMVV